MPDNPHLGELAPGGAVGSSPGNEPPRWQPPENLAAWSERRSIPAEGTGRTTSPWSGGSAGSISDLSDRTHASYPDGGNDAATGGIRGIPPQNASDLQMTPDLDKWPAGGTGTEQSSTSMPGGVNGIPPSPESIGGNDMGTTPVKHGFDPGVGDSGRNRDDIPAEDFAGPHRSFPITSESDVSDAASLAHHADNPDEVRRNIKRIARKKWPNMQLPETIETAKMMPGWSVQNRGHGQLPGHAQDSPGSLPGPQGPSRHPMTGVYQAARAALASGHYTRPDEHGTDCLWNQPDPLAPQLLSSLVTSCPPEGAIGSSITAHQGRAMVQQLDMAGASQPFLNSQLGRNAPSGDPSRATAAPSYTPQPTPVPEPGTVWMTTKAPGSQFTTRLPCND
jgi:hypothetical protein